MRVLVCGGAGYIGSHACVELMARGHDIAILDNFCNGSEQVPGRIARIAGRDMPVHRVDVRDRDALSAVLQAGRFDCVMHFAALKAVGDSVARPLEYFDNNIVGTVRLLQAMRDHGVPYLVFSSSATVYGLPDSVPVREDARLQVTNPYGRTKLVAEEMIGDLQASGSGPIAANLRYFNPIGAHASGTIGEDPRGEPDNLMPYICQVAVGRRDRLRVFGDDWPTVDGTGVRDYIHVVDLARAHADAMDCLARTGQGVTVNLGTGTGVSVLQLIRAFERASGRTIPYDIVERRPGDVAEVFADPSRAEQLLGWGATLDVDAMCRDAWRWQCMNPQGYGAASSDHDSAATGMPLAAAFAAG